MVRLRTASDGMAWHATQPSLLLRHLVALRYMSPAAITRSMSAFSYDLKPLVVTDAIIGREVPAPKAVTEHAATARAKGTEALTGLRGRTEPLAAKVVERLPEQVADAVDALREAGVTVVGTDVTGGEPFDQGVLDRPVAIVMGSEPHGLDRDVDVDAWAHIAMPGRTESLNVAMAGTLLLHEASRC